MLKLYRFDRGEPEYWETWDAGGGAHIVHWGTLGTRGESETFRSSIFQRATSKIQSIIDKKVEEGFRPVELEDHHVLLVEYDIQGDFANEEELAKRHSLEARMNETLGWTGLGFCDGGSSGEGTMEVCCFVVDFEIAKSVIAADFKGSGFQDYSRIYDEDSE